MKYETEFAELKMTPEMWKELDKTLSADMYRALVNDYQNREWERLPKCNAPFGFGICQNFSFGKCTYSGGV